MQPRNGRRAFALAAALVCAQQASAQVFVSAPGNVPQGSPFNSGSVGQIDFADIDLDGDWDCGIAKGNDCCNMQNRIWVNQGGVQGGTLGFFADETATRAPAVSDMSRDLEFVDFDGDGDPDVFSVNTSSIVNQGGRWWTNQGMMQGGAIGTFVDETAARWIGLGGAGSSVPPALVLGTGGFITWGHDQDFVDVDADGDLDLIAATIGGAFGGQEPTRIFLNDGLGFFSELNPSGFQLTGATIQNGDPALWAEGTHQSDTNDFTGAFADVAMSATAVIAGDVDGDLDVDLLFVDRMKTPRLFLNRLSETGVTVFRDATGSAWPPGAFTGNAKYEGELGDLDGDGDLDVYGVNWLDNFSDGTLRGVGDATFEAPVPVAGTSADEAFADLVDYDSDGDLDVFIASFSGASMLVSNGSTPAGLAFSLVPGAVSELNAGGGGDVDAADVDGDGDSDIVRGKSPASELLLNVLNVPDTTAPRHALLEQPADHASGVATPIRVHVYDNAGADQTGWGLHELAYSVDNGPFQSAPMGFMGGQVFGGELPASAVGNVRYFVSSTDEHGNTGTSKFKSIDTNGGCSGQVATYCTGKLNTQGCVPHIDFAGAPKAGGTTNFLIRGHDVLPGQTGLLFYSKTGPANVPFNGGTLCIGGQIVRTPGLVSSGAGLCGGTYEVNFNVWISMGVDPLLVPGQKVWAQYWCRDPLSSGGSGLTDGVTFTICP
ncbi:MAG TPA: VCBS repeat-containing protein [Planctomycetota bacterium]|nr:VCBS repeat-containing protein [Planctomycetota bacterium]